MADSNQNLTVCPNPMHMYRIGPLVVGWQVAADYWATGSGDGNKLKRIWFETTTTRYAKERVTVFGLVVLKLYLAVIWDK